MINELRMYTTRPGKMKYVVNASATVAQKIRGGDTYGKLIGHWWSEIGKMNQYVHMWSYKDVEEMRRLRSELAAKEDWKKKFIPLVGPNILTQDIRLLRPLTKINKPKNSTNIYELKIISLNIFEVRTGTTVFDWKVPNEWNIKRQDVRLSLSDTKDFVVAIVFISDSVRG